MTQRRAEPPSERIGIVMNGVTGRMGRNQHLMRSIKAILDDGGVALPDGRRLVPDPILVGRDVAKLERLAAETGIARWSDDLEASLADPAYGIYFDAVTTQQRPDNLRRAIAAGKHIYAEKPVAPTLAESLELAGLAERAGVRTGVVQDKLYLPGLLKLKRLVDGGFFGRILSVRGEFGYWVFEGNGQEPQRPSWNYRREEGGGIILDMLPHWRYVLDHIVAEVRSVLCLGATHVEQRWDERGAPYAATADDAAYALFELDGGVVAQINASWSTRVYRDELLALQVDGTEGSAVAGLRSCKAQHRGVTPRPVWNPDVPNPIDFFAGWQEVPDNQPFMNGFRAQWEAFLRHVATGAPFPHTLLEGAKGVQLAELAHLSWRERRWVDVPPLDR